MNILVCVKRVPQTGGRIVLTPDAKAIDTRFLGFTVSPHEECAVEEAIRLVEAHGGTSAVLTLGPEAATAQLRDALAVGIDRGILLETDGSDWDPMATAAAISEAIRDEEAAHGRFDLILFGNESADSGGYQVGVRVAAALGRPFVAGIKAIRLEDGQVVARRPVDGGTEVYRLPLPACLAVKEGINLPRYPSVPGRLRAKQKEIRVLQPAYRPGGPEMLRLRLPEEAEHRLEILGRGPEAAPAVVALLRDLGLLEH